MLADPLARFPVGVNVAVRISPLPEIGPMVPPLTTTSPLVPSHVKVLPGSSLKMKVIVAVSPAFSALLSLTMLSVGASVKMVMLGLVPAAPGLPAASV